jgi:hypothetical protein
LITYQKSVAATGRPIVSLAIHRRKASDCSITCSTRTRPASSLFATVLAVFGDSSKS